MKYEQAVSTNAKEGATQAPVAVISAVLADSPAYDAGFEAGCAIERVDGHVLHDILDWRWYSDTDEIELAYIDLDGEHGSVVLQREFDEPWGFEFKQALFDDVKQCCNACTFCFMRQLPREARKSLTLRDDDYRLSFLQGTFVTLTNCTDKDVARIIEQHISPLRFSLHASNHEVRRGLIGPNEARGLEVFFALQEAGITFEVQIVLVPGVNDGAALDETLLWALEQPAIETLGIVPLGYTKHQKVFSQSYDEASRACEVLEQVERFQKRALDLRGRELFYAADEFYLNAHDKATADDSVAADDNVAVDGNVAADASIAAGGNVAGDDNVAVDGNVAAGDSGLLQSIPSADFYGAFTMLEDGIGMVRLFIDEWRNQEAALQDFAGDARMAHAHFVLLSGEAFSLVLRALIAEANVSDVFAVQAVKNDYFGGNVNVTGLLCAADLVPAIKACADVFSTSTLCLPNIIFNADNLTLDGVTRGTLENVPNARVCVVSCSITKMLCELRTFSLRK